MTTYFWVGNQRSGTGNLDWGNALNWSPSTGTPGSADSVIFQGFYGTGAGDDAIVDGTGAAYQMTLEGPIEFQSNFNVVVSTDVADYEGSVLSVDPGASWTVDGDLNFLNTYQSGYADDLYAYGAVDILGTLGATWGSYVQIASTGTMDVDGIGLSTGIAAGQAGIAFQLYGNGTLDDTDGIAAGIAVTVLGNDAGSATFGGTSTLDEAQIQAASYSDVSFGSVSSALGAVFMVQSPNASIELDASGAAAGQFTLGGNLLTSGAITAPIIAIDGTLEVNANSSETLSGTLTGSGDLQIDNNATLTINNAPTNYLANTITFNDSSGLLVLQAAGNFSPLIQNFTSGDVIDLTNFSSAQITGERALSDSLLVTLTGEIDGQTTSYALGIAGPQAEQLDVSPDQYGGGTLIQYVQAVNEFDWSDNGATNDWSDIGNWYDLVTDQPASTAPVAGDLVAFGELAGVGAAARPSAAPARPMAWWSPPNWNW